MDLPPSAESLSNTIESKNGSLLVNIFQRPVAAVASNNKDTISTTPAMLSGEMKAAPKPEILESGSLELGQKITDGDTVAGSGKGSNVAQTRPVLQALRFEEIGEKRNQLVLEMES